MTEVRSASPSSPAPPPRELEAGVFEELESFVRALKGAGALARVSPRASLERDLGLGSLERMELLTRLERRLGRRLDRGAVARIETVQELAEALGSAADATAAAPALDVGGPRARSELGPPETAASLGEVLARRARAEPDVPHVLLEPDGGGEAVTLSFGALYRDALTVAGGLRHRGLERGQTVAIMLPTGRDFFAAFMGTILAGGVPVPLYPPFNLGKIAEFAARQARILANAGARFFVTLREGRAVGLHLESSAPALREVLTVEELLDEARSAAPVAAGADDPALIQYTSGSTGDPKGVLLTHGNLLANVRAIGGTLRMGPGDVGVSWLPLYHDMGLIGAWLTPMYYGFPVSILSPLAFLSRPERWLWTLHQRRGTISPAPNFAYEICRRKIRDEDLEGLDLGAWRVALNGAEPISPKTLEGFSRRFAPYGFRATAFLPVYGLAEASLLLAAPELGAPSRVLACDRARFESEGVVAAPAASERSPLQFVSVGRPVPGHEVRVVDEGGGALPERRVGRLLFRGPSASAGYFRNESATAAMRREDGFLASGDRAFIADGDLFVTGREKDLIIKAGRNLVPQELEDAASEVGGVRAGSVAAFGVTDEASGTERIVLVAERREVGDAARVRHEIEAALLDAVGIAPDDVVLVPPRSLPKTSSGKLRRSATKDRYLEGKLSAKTGGSSWLLLKLSLKGLRDRLCRAARRAGRLVYGAYAALLTAAFVLPLWASAVVLPRSALRRLGRGASRLYLRASGVALNVEGEGVSKELDGPAVFVANHASYLDPLPLMAALEGDYAFVVKREAFSWPLVGRFLRKSGHVPVDRATAGDSLTSTTAMLEALAGGRSLVLFPEGTFTYATGLRPFKLGAFHLAAESGRPVVPVALVGTRRWLRDGSLVPRPGRLDVVFGAPRPVASAFEAVAAACEDVARELAEQVGEPRLDLTAAGVARDGVS